MKCTVWYRVSRLKMCWFCCACVRVVSVRTCTCGRFVLFSTGTIEGWGGVGWGESFGKDCKRSVVAKQKSCVVHEK